MAANTTPIYPLVGELGWIASAMTAANTTRDLTSGTTYTVYTCAGAAGANVIKIRFTSNGTNPQTAARIWLNNGSTTGTAGNNVLIHEVTLPATKASETEATPYVDVPLTVRLFPTGYKVIVTLGTAVTDGWRAIVFAEDY